MVITLIFIHLVSCKEEELRYKDDAGIYIDKAIISGIRDSMGYTFAEKANTLMIDTFYIPVKISGNIASFERSIPLKVVPNLTTAIEGTHFRILDTKVKANEIDARVPIVLYRTADLKTQQVRLFVRIEKSPDFPLLITKTKTVGTLTGEPNTVFVPGYLIKITDQLIKPDTWDANGSWFLFYFGTYSARKYKFIIDVTGRTVWGPRARDGEDAPKSSELRVYNAQLQTALFEHEKINGPLLDETGNQVIFPKL